MRIVCISDTHLHQGFPIPDGDVLIHAGDGTSQGTWREVAQWLNWMAAQPHRRKIVVAGNHDFLFETEPEVARLFVPDSIDYLQDSGTRFRGVNFWGSPWQPAFNDWAFNLPRGPQLEEKWKLIPNDTDVLSTHSPPFGILDRVLSSPLGEAALATDVDVPLGCEDLLFRVHAIRPRVHVFGHIHDSYGTQILAKTIFVNACICDEDYKPTRAPIVIDLPKKARRP